MISFPISNCTDGGYSYRPFPSILRPPVLIVSADRSMPGTLKSRTISLWSFPRSMTALLSQKWLGMIAIFIRSLWSSIVESPTNNWILRAAISYCGILWDFHTSPVAFSMLLVSSVSFFSSPSSYRWNHFTFRCLLSCSQNCHGNE